VVESTKSQVHFDDRQGKVPFCDVEACARELWTRVSRIFLLSRKETKGLSEKMEDASWSFFKIWKFLLMTSLTLNLKDDNLTLGGFFCCL
jgi:hypothetical protein